MKILVAVDLTESTAVIVQKSRELASALSAHVWLIHVADPDPSFVGYGTGPQYERDAVAEKYRREHTELQNIAKELRAADLDTTTLLVQGPTASTILDEAAKIDADMVVAGTHSKGAMHRLLVGSVSEELLRHAPCPILIVPTHPNPVT